MAEDHRDRDGPVRAGRLRDRAAFLRRKPDSLLSGVSKPVLALAHLSVGIGRIGRDRSFTEENARSLKWVAWLAAGDACFFFAGNVLLLLLNMSHAGVFLLSLLVVFTGAAIAVAAAALSHLVGKAAALQEQSDLTI